MLTMNTMHSNKIYANSLFSNYQPKKSLKINVTFDSAFWRKDVV